MVLADFDGVTYRISTPESKTKLLVSMCMTAFAQLKTYGAEQVLRRIYGPLLQATPEPGFDVSVLVDLEALPADTGTILLI